MMPTPQYKSTSPTYPIPPIICINNTTDIQYLDLNSHYKILIKFIKTERFF